jgi:hypothetical protein
MPTDDPTTPPSRGEGGVPTRELLFHTIVRIRQDLARAERLAELIGITQPTPPEVDQAIRVLDRWTRELLRAGPPRPPGGHRPPGP